MWVGRRGRGGDVWESVRGEKRSWDDPKMHSWKERTMNGERCGWGGGTGG